MISGAVRGAEQRRVVAHLAAIVAILLACRYSSLRLATRENGVFHVFIFIVARNVVKVATKRSSLRADDQPSIANRGTRLLTAAPMASPLQAMIAARARDLGKPCHKSRIDIQLRPVIDFSLRHGLTIPMSCLISREYILTTDCESVWLQLRQSLRVPQ